MRETLRLGNPVTVFMQKLLFIFFILPSSLSPCQMGLWVTMVYSGSSSIDYKYPGQLCRQNCPTRRIEPVELYLTGIGLGRILACACRSGRFPPSGHPPFGNQLVVIAGSDFERTREGRDPGHDIMSSIPKRQLSSLFDDLFAPTVGAGTPLAPNFRQSLTAYLVADKRKHMTAFHQEDGKGLIIFIVSLLFFLYS